MTEAHRVLPPLFPGPGPERLALRRRDPVWLDRAWPRGRALPLSAAAEVPVLRDGAGVRLGWRSPEKVPDGLLRLFLGERASVPYFAVTARPGAADPFAAEAAAADGEQWLGLRAAATDLADADAALLVTATALGTWHRQHPRCPRCGAGTEVEQAGWVRRCPADGSEHWPRIDPAVIMLVHDGADRCVLGRGRSWPAGRYSALAGFVEPGESVEAAVAREVAEEVGLDVTDVEYRGSQPWPFPASLMFGFWARATGDDQLRVDPLELADARWFTRSQLREGVVRLPPRISIASEIITRWLELD